MDKITKTYNKKYLNIIWDWMKHNYVFKGYYIITQLDDLDQDNITVIYTKLQPELNIPDNEWFET
jgi:hypothetical protein